MKRLSILILILLFTIGCATFGSKEKEQIIELTKEVALQSLERELEELLYPGMVVTPLDNMTDEEIMELAEKTKAAANTYTSNTSPLSTDQLLGIDDPSGTWGINVFPIANLITLFSTSPTFTLPTLGVATATTLDTGEGANELFDMDQNVLTSSSPTFAALTITDDSNNRFTEAQTAQTLSGTAPDVTFGGTPVVRRVETNSNGTITDFTDGTDHGDFANGDWFEMLISDAGTTIDCNTGTNIKCGRGSVNFTGSASTPIDVLVKYYEARWNIASLGDRTTPTTLALSSINMGEGTLEIPNGTDPDVDTAGEISWDSDDFWLRTWNGTTQRALPTKFPIPLSVAEPDGMDARDYMPIFTNNLGASVVILSMYCMSDDDDVDFRIEEYDADGSSNEALVKAETCDTGSGPYTNDAQTTITNATIEDGHILVFDFDDTDTPDYLHCTIWYRVNGDVD